MSNKKELLSKLQLVQEQINNVDVNNSQVDELLKVLDNLQSNVFRILDVQKEEQDMGSVGNTSRLPKYSEENGIITESTVKEDNRYNGLYNIFNEFKVLSPSWENGQKEYINKGQGRLAGDFLRTIMRMEESGQTSGELNINIWDGEDLRTKMSVYRKALKSLGYKVTKQENTDWHHRGYNTVRGGRVYASTSRKRRLYFEKVNK